MKIGRVDCHGVNTKGFFLFPLYTGLVRFANLTKEVNRVWVVHVPLERLEDVFLCLNDLAFCVR